jgi:hypothetical protein
MLRERVRAFRPMPAARDLGRMARGDDGRCGAMEEEEAGQTVPR